jgi:hypothetical protein
MIQQSVDYRRPISLTVINTGLDERLEEGLPIKWPLKTGRINNTYTRKVDFKFTLIKQDKEGHFILIKGEIHQEEITIITLYAPNVSVCNYTKHTLKDLKAHIDYNTMGLGDFNNPYHK